MRSVMNNEQKDLCPSSQPVTEFLLGVQSSLVDTELDFQTQITTMYFTKNT